MTLRSEMALAAWEAVHRSDSPHAAADAICVLLRQSSRSGAAVAGLELVAAGVQDRPALRDDDTSNDGVHQVPAGMAPTGLLKHIVADTTGHQRLIAPLMYRGEVLGAAVLSATGDRSFGASERDAFDAVREPLAAALVAHLRNRELELLRRTGAFDAPHSGDAADTRREGGETIVGAEAGLRQVMERVDLVARSDVPVLIFGETGSGKEVIARAIHHRSARSDGPFMRVNCGAIPPELIDSELFGHEKGSFTGATSARQGWFERADGGTLFLDEIGELPPAAQVRLLRILQDGTYERVGGQKQRTVHVRIVAATHRDLPTMIDEGRFREDLWYRIATFPVRLPPLRERLEDIPALAEHFAMKAARRFGLHPLSPSAEDLRLLAAYPWPGNIRELGAVMDRAAILGDGRRLEVAKSLGLDGSSQMQRPAASDTLSPAVGLIDRPRVGPVSGPPTIQPLDAAAAQHIEHALQTTHGRVDGPFGAAKLLQINPHTLRARMRKLGINWRKFRSSAAKDRSN